MAEFVGFHSGSVVIENIKIIHINFSLVEKTG